MRFSGVVEPSRSRTMSHIRSRGSRSTEKKARAQMVRAGIRGWRMNAADIEGRPDFFFFEKKLAVFIDGCFWHGCKKCYRRPKSRQEYWDWKVRRNTKRDRQVNTLLTRKGLRPLRFWEHELIQSPQRVIARIQKALSERRPFQRT